MISVRPMAGGEEAIAAALARRVFDEHVAPLYSEEGRAAYHRYADPAAVAARAANHRLWLAEDGGDAVGVLEVRNAAHVSMLFVDTGRQRAGIARALLRAAFGPADAWPALTVFSAPNAVAAYERMGFEATGAEQETDGIRFVPMRRPAREPSRDDTHEGRVTESRRLLQHFVAALAYRTQKALRGAPAGFGDFRAGAPGQFVRTPHELLWHMTGVVGYARTMLHGGRFQPPRMPTFDDEVARFHETLAALRDDFGDASLEARITDEQFLQGPLADAMTHAGQLAMLRRLAGAPVASENFIFAKVSRENVSADQPAPAAPDEWWRPDQPPQPPGARPRAIE
jgi:GNAT superfamily N-acetyltransferase